MRGVPGWPWGEAAGAFVTGAVADTADRVKAALGCDVAVANGLEAGAVIEAANAAGAQAVVTAYAPVGPVADALDGLDVSLAGPGFRWSACGGIGTSGCGRLRPRGFLLSGSTWQCMCPSALGDRRYGDVLVAGWPMSQAA